MLDDLIQALMFLVIVGFPLAMIAFGVRELLCKPEHTSEKVKPFDGYYEGCYRSLLAEFEEERR